MTEQAAEEDISLFRLFAARETRSVLVALLEKPMRQRDLCEKLSVSQPEIGPPVRRLIAASLVVRDTPRGELRLSRFDQIAALLELEAQLSDDIQENRRKRSAARKRQVQKGRMSGKAAQASRHSA